VDDGLSKFHEDCYLLQVMTINTPGWVGCACKKMYYAHSLVLMSALPPEVNLYETTILPNHMRSFIGRG
jgi:hypothetical protein